MAIITNIDPQTFEIQQYNEGDQTTIPSFNVNSLFTLSNGRVESLVYDLSGNLLFYNPNAQYSIVENELGAGPEFANTMLLFPEEEVANIGATEGNYNVAYNFFNNELNSSFDQRFALKEISANRKELRLVTNAVSENELKELVNEFFPEVISTPDYPDFYINFGSGRLYIANNCVFDNTNGQYSVLIKLYEPLPSSIEEKDTLWVVTEHRNTAAYNVKFEQQPFIVKDTIDLKGPNFSLSSNNNVHTSVELKSLSELSTVANLDTSSYNQLQSLLQEKGVNINVDYTKLDNFTHFSSAERRVRNFYHKVSLIESASNEIAAAPTGSASGPLAGTAISSSKAKLENQITDIIKNFDGFEYYMYYNSQSIINVPVGEIYDTGFVRGTDTGTTGGVTNITNLESGNSGGASTTLSTLNEGGAELFGFNFNIPANTIIRGIEIKTQFNSDNSTDTVTFSTKLTSSLGEGTTFNTILSPDQSSVDVRGNQNDLMGLSGLTNSNVNNLTMSFTMTGNSSTALVEIGASEVGELPSIKVYYQSSSIKFPSPYPKTTTTEPYTLAGTGSTEVLRWYDSALATSSLYDGDNQDNLTNTIPEYVLEDPDNEPYKKFVEMIGQHFDTLFTYAQDITNKYNADNRLDFGISKDLVAEAIKSMGINLHTGNFNSTDLITSYIGGVSGNNYSTPLPDGQSLSQIDNYISASDGPIPIEDINNQIYKRIYHNLPLLLKKKGSVAGLRTLITTFGIPEEIFGIREYSITGKPTIQSLPAPGTTGSITFDISSISLPTTSSQNSIASPPSEFLSPLIRVQQDYLKSESYNRSLHYVEAGFSPSNTIDDELSASNNAVYEKLTGDPGQYIGDFDNFYFGEGNTYSGLVGTYSNYYGGTPWNTAAFIRYVKFLDSSLFSMIKDFTPVRSAVATGVIIKPTLQQRSIQRPASMSLEDITFEGTVFTEGFNLADDNPGSGSIMPIGKRNQFITSSGYSGGTGGVFEDFNRIKFSSSLEDWSNRDLPTPISNGFQQIWGETVVGPGITGSGIGAATHTKIHSDQAEFYDGIFFQTPQTRSSNTSNPNGVFQTDNNPQNPYKKPTVTQTYAHTAKGIISNYLNIISNIASTPASVAISPAYVFFYQDFDSLFFNVNSAGTDGIIQQVLEGNGSTITFQHSTGLYTLQVLSTSLFFGDNSTVVEVAVAANYLEGDRDTFINTAMANNESITLVPNWDPINSDNDLIDTNPGPFLYSDYNPIINNTSDPGLTLENYEGIRKSTIYQDADYSGAASSSILPINNELLSLGSASKAAIPDSNYSSKFWIRSRYEGNRISSLDFNRRIISVVPPGSELFTTASLGFDFNESSSGIPSSFEPPYLPGGG